MLVKMQLETVGTVERERERERESYTLVNKSEGLLNKQKIKIIDGNIMPVLDTG